VTGKKQQIEPKKERRVPERSLRAGAADVLQETKIKSPRDAASGQATS